MLRKAKTTGAPIILEEGMKYTPVTLSPEDAQFVSTKLQCIDQVAAAFRVPPHKVGDLTRGTYSNNEQGNIEFYIDCIRPKIEQLEEELNSKLFLESEKAEYYIDIDFRGLFRADTATRKDWYKELYYIGVFSPNEIRALEDMPPYEGGDQHYVPVNMTTPSNLENINQNGKSE
jgi:HK97 family phage portal protein